MRVSLPVRRLSISSTPATGKFTSLNGIPKGSISNDGTIESPNLGTIKLDTKTNEVSMDGEVIGSVTKLRASCYGTDFGQLEGHVSPLLVAYIFHGALISKNQVQGWKEAEVKRTEEAKARAAKEKEERAARLEAEKKEWAELNVTIEDGSFRTIGRIKSNGTIEDGSFRTIGRVRQDGTVEDGSFRTIGRINSNGTVEDGSFRTIGRFDGRLFEDGSFRTVGRMSGSTVEDDSFRTIGRIKGTSNKTLLAACFYFFYFKAQAESKK